MLLEIGAANVTTLEYNEIESKVDNIRVIGKLANCIAALCEHHCQ